MWSIPQGRYYFTHTSRHHPDIPITTFMIATDPALQEFVSDFTEANNGRAFFTGLKGLGDTIFADFERNRRGRAR